MDMAALFHNKNLRSPPIISPNKLHLIAKDLKINSM
jgi:hypothetical protein